jgi:hypothetical protein
LGSACQEVKKPAALLRHRWPLQCLNGPVRQDVTQPLHSLASVCDALASVNSPEVLDDVIYQWDAGVVAVMTKLYSEPGSESKHSLATLLAAAEQRYPITAADGGAKANPRGSQPTETISLNVRVTAFMNERMEKLDRLPTLEEIRQIFPGEIGPDSTFYRNNPWFKTIRAGLREVLKQTREATKGHKNISEDEEGVTDSVDAALPAPNYYQDEED